MTETPQDIYLNIDTWVDIIAVVFMSAIGFYRYRKISIPSKAILWCLVIECILNNVTDVFKERCFSITPILYVSYFKSVVLMALFFNYIIPFFKKIHMGVFFGIITAGFWFINTLFFKSYKFPAIGYAPIETNYSAELIYMYFLSFFMLISIVLYIIALFVLFRKNDWSYIRLQSSFWLLVVNMFTDGLSFITSTVMPLVDPKHIYANKELYNFIALVMDWLPGDLGTVAFGIIFLIFPKKNKLIEQ